MVKTKILLLKIFNFFYWLPVSVGNHTHYDGGGGGGGGGGNDFSTNHSTDHSYSTSGDSGDTDNPIGLYVCLGIIVMTAILVIISRIKDKKYKKAKEQELIDFRIELRAKATETVLSGVRQHDPNFSSEKFLSWSKEVFCQLQQAWTERDWKKARPFESEELFNLHKSQLDEYIRNGTINVMENVSVNDAWFNQYKVEGNYEYVTVFMETSYRDYIIDEHTQKVVRGDKNREYHVNYLLKFMRSLNVKTGELSNKSTHNCPNCGAPVNVNAAGQCAYCGTVITDGNHDWVLCNLDDCGQS